MVRERELPLFSLSVYPLQRTLPSNYLRIVVMFSFLPSLSFLSYHADFSHPTTAASLLPSNFCSLRLPRPHPLLTHLIALSFASTEPTEVRRPNLSLYLSHTPTYIHTHSIDI